MATGEFVGLMDCDDYLAVNALYEMAKLLNNNPEYDFIYSDEDKVNEEGNQRRDPFLNRIGHLTHLCLICIPVISLYSGRQYLTS